MIGLIWTFIFASLTIPTPVFADSVKEWTFLTYIAGVNNLDPYSGPNINEMEKAGSSEQLNVVVQWASERTHTARRMLILKDTDEKKVTSPVLEEFPTPDTGDWRSLVEFIRWGVTHYPAKHYFINIWSHGSGWHQPPMGNGPELSDISPDDRTGRSISTRELGLAMQEAAQIIGHKVDIYGSDACLMSMLEIATELSASVSVYTGSQATEPGDGWPYASFLSAWKQLSSSDPRAVATLLTEKYVAAYSNGELGKKQGTFSALDLERLAPLLSGLARFSQDLLQTDSRTQLELARKFGNVSKFTEPDYRDLGAIFTEALASGLNAPITEFKTFVLSNKTTPNYKSASGVSIWMPDKDHHDLYQREYEKLKFHSITDWGNVVKLLAR